MPLRPFQQDGVRRGEEFFAAAVRGSHLLLKAPTGTGKSSIELALLREGRYIVTPSLEIVRGFLQKMGVEAPISEEALAAAGQERGVWTPGRLRNKLVAGTVRQPSGLIWDEAHHAESDSWQEIELLCGDPPSLGLTATPYRGTPRSTGSFLARWGQPVELISIREAQQLGYLSVPSCEIAPLLDDDVIEVVDGEFSVRSANAAIASRVSATCDLIGRYWDGRVFDKPTMLALPSTETVGYFVESLLSRGIPAARVTGDTSSADRDVAFSACLSCMALLVQIKVVGEGVDLPIRRLIDQRPTLSPVAWLQQLGRITRPGGGSEYVCCNRNLLRHAYLLEGLVPPAVLSTGEQLFNGPGTRAAARAIGLEALGRFKPADVKFLDGTTGQLFCVSQVQGTTVTQYAVVFHPCIAESLVARRCYSSECDPRKRGRWERIDRVPELVGYQSVPPQEVTPRMKAWWCGEQKMRGAEWYGLEPNVKLDRKRFQVLPILADTRFRFGVLPSGQDGGTKVS